MPLYKNENGKPKVISSGAGITPTITENENNTDTEYRLDIKTVDGKITTPNLMGSGGSDITISAETGNAIEEKEDGIYVSTINISEYETNAITIDENGALYVEDKSEELEKIQAELSPKVKYHKYLNTELDSCYCVLRGIYTPVTGEYVPFQKSSGSFEIRNGRVVIKPGQRVQINIALNYQNTSNSNYSNIQYYVKDYTNDKVLTMIQPIINAQYEYNYNCTCQYSNDTDIECEVGLYVGGVYVSDSLNNISSMTVQEINRQIVIDPVEHVNTDNGIEDTPVGHIISHMGKVAPEHYLICDGTEYNIADYPYLAQHFAEQFGTANNFGGDGITTFAVPDLRGEFLRGTGVATRNTGNGADVGVHQDGTSTPLTILSNNQLYMYHGDYSELSQTEQTNKWVATMNADKLIGVNQPYQTKISGSQSSTTNASAKYTTRPTNTSVLYCIKYEPTYFMKNVYNGNKEVILYEGDTKVECSTTSTTHNLEIYLADSIENYDTIKIRYSGYGSSYNRAVLNFKTVDVDSILNGDVWLTLVWAGNIMSASCKFTDASTFNIQSSVFYNPANGTTSVLGINIYSIVGVKSVSASSDSSDSTEDIYYTNEEISTGIDAILGGES